MRERLERHPNLVSWAVLAIGMVAVLAWSARDVALTLSQWAWLALATVLLAGLCAWIISWEADDEGVDEPRAEGADEPRAEGVDEPRAERGDENRDEATEETGVATADKAADGAGHRTADEGDVDAESRGAGTAASPSAAADDVHGGDVLDGG